MLPVFFSGTVAAFITLHYSRIEQLTIIEKLLYMSISAILLALSFFPNTVACLLLGYIYGWEAILWLMWMYGIALILGFFMGLITKSNRPASLSAYAGAESWLTRLQHSHIELTFLSRFSPVLSFAATNLVLVWLGVRFRTFWLYSVLGMLPRMLILVWIALGINDVMTLLEGKSTPEQWVVTVSFILIGVIGYIWIWKRFHKKDRSIKR